MTACGAISRQGNVCAREAEHRGCHEVYVDGDGRRWWGDVRDDLADLTQLLREADAVRNAAESLLLSRKGWERWGEHDAFLYDRLGGFGNGSVYTLPEALEKLTQR